MKPDLFRQLFCIEIMADVHCDGRFPAGVAVFIPI